MYDVVRCAAFALAVADASSCGPSAAPAGAPAPVPVTTRPAPHDVTEISLERHCFGCAEPFRVVLGRDGTASRTVPGNARQGTSDRSWHAAIPATEFEALAELLVAEGFFELEDEYRDPRLADGESLTTRAVRGGKDKTVLDSNRAGPPALKRIEEAIQAQMSRLTWRPDGGS